MISGWKREYERQHSWCCMARGMDELVLCLISGCRGEQVVGMSGRACGQDVCDGQVEYHVGSIWNHKSIVFLNIPLSIRKALCSFSYYCLLLISIYNENILHDSFFNSHRINNNTVF